MFFVIPYIMFPAYLTWSKTVLSMCVVVSVICYLMGKLDLTSSERCKNPAGPPHPIQVMYHSVRHFERRIRFSVSAHGSHLAPGTTAWSHLRYWSAYDLCLWRFSRSSCNLWYVTTSHVCQQENLILTSYRFNSKMNWLDFTGQRSRGRGVCRLKLVGGGIQPQGSHSYVLPIIKSAHRCGWNFSYWVGGPKDEMLGKQKGK